MTEDTTPVQPENTNQPEASPAEGLNLGSDSITGSSPEPAATEPVTPSPAPQKKNKHKDVHTWGTGRRKSSVARVRIKEGEGKFVINTKKFDEYFKLDKHRNTINKPLEVTGTSSSYDVFVNVNGGGISGQAGAISLGLSRALAQLSDEFNLKLRENDLMSRDARKVERKKYGQRGARRRFQFSKR